MRRRCPVCWRRVRPTIHHAIEGHWDTASTTVCPASGEPYRITLTAKPTQPRQEAA